MRTSRDFRKRLDYFEAKGIFRRVRTVEGSRRFGQPIGSVIVADPIPNLPRNITRRSVRADTRGKGPILSRLRARVPQRSEATAAKKVKATWQVNAGGSNKYHSVQTEDGYSAVFVTSDNDEYKPLIATVLGPRGQADRRFETGTHDPVKARKVVEARINALRKSAPVRSPRGMETFYDYHQGTYGWDFQDADTNWTEDSWDDPVTRRTMAIRESQNLGLLMLGSVNHRTGETKRVDSEVHEEINGLMRTYETMYPGFTKFLPAFQLDERMSRQPAIANNGRIAGGDSAANGGPMDITVIGLNPKYFSSRGYKGEIVNAMQQGIDTGWFSLTNLDEIAKQGGVEKWQAAMQGILNHEVGHTVARMIFGELRHPNIDSEKYRSSFLEGFGNILWNHGVLDDENWEALQKTDTVSGHVTNRTERGTEGNYPFTIDMNIMRGHLSRYGASNMHEIMAETWAAYMMDPNLTDLVRELGTFMDELMQQWIEEATS